MATPDPLDGLMLPYSIVLQPAWNDPMALVMTEYRDPTVSDPSHRIRIPAGMTVVRITEDVRFTPMVKYLRGGTERELGTVIGSATFEVVSETDTEMWFEWSGIPNTNDRSTTRLGITIFPTVPF